jgi:hypothetical protein
LDGWVRWDSGWYLGIASEGYIATKSQVLASPHAQRSTAFFPGYPLAVRLVRHVVGDLFWAGFIVTNVSFLTALCLLWQIAREAVDAEAANRVVWLVAAYPFAFVFTAEYSEGLFLLGVTGAFYFAQRQQLLRAALFAALAGATRVFGILAVLPVVWVYIQRTPSSRRSLLRLAFFCLVGASGLLAYMAYLYGRFGTPFEFVHAQQGWLGGRPFLPINRALWVEFLLTIGVLALALLSFAISDRSLGAWAVLMALTNFTHHYTIGRLAVVIFPIFLLVARFLSGRPRVFLALVGTGLLLEASLAVLFARYYTMNW